MSRGVFRNEERSILTTCSRMRDEIHESFSHRAQVLNCHFAVKFLRKSLKEMQMGPHISEGGRCAGKTVERKALKWCTFSPEDPKV